MYLSTQEVMDKIRPLIRDNETIIYLVYFGSHLYGTHNEDSDLDVKGIFLPSMEDLILRNYRKSINWKSGTDNDKNSKDDIDIELWSLHYFFDILSKGDTNAVDLLFSHTNNKCIIFKNYKIPEIDTIFNNPLKLFNPKYTESFTHYAVGQAKRYGIKGSRLGVLKRIYKYLNTSIVNFENRKLRDIYGSVIDNFYDPSFCFSKVINDEDAIVICGKTHLLSIPLEEFYKRIEREYKKYGERAELAEQGKGLDFKAISHAVRAIEQNKELLLTGKIEYPLKSADYIRGIKNGKYSWQKCEEIINNGLEEVHSLSISDDSFEGKYDSNFVNFLILKLYGRMYESKYVYYLADKYNFHYIY